MGVIIEESGLRFGEYYEDQVFQIEASEQYTKSLRQNGIKTCEFILRKGKKLLIPLSIWYWSSIHRKENGSRNQNFKMTCGCI